MDRHEGVITAVIGSRGFGFIASGASKYFFHFSQYEVGKIPVVGLEVTFKVLADQSGKSPVAGDVRVREGGAQ